jgi:hypothetical protein
MRQSNPGRRPRGRPNRKHHVPSRSQTFDSSGPDIRVRGNAHQVYEKYLALARDATSAGDRVTAEGYYQFAEHYFRVLNDSTDPQPLHSRPVDRQGDRPGGPGDRRDQRPGPHGGEQPYVDQPQPDVQPDFPASAHPAGPPQPRDQQPRHEAQDHAVGPGNGAAGQPVERPVEAASDGEAAPRPKRRPRRRPQQDGRNAKPNGTADHGAEPGDDAGPSAEDVEVTVP